MKLMTKELEDRFKEVGSQEEVPFKDKVIIAKYFNPVGAGTWWATEYDPVDKIFFGFVTLGLGEHCDEWGSFSLQELESVQLPFGLGIERDLHYGERKVSEVPQIKTY